MGEAPLKGHYKLGRKHLKIFLDALRKGMKRQRAMEQTGLQLQTLYSYIKEHPEFKDEITNAELEYADKQTDAMEDALFKNGVENMSFSAQVFWLQNMRPDKWKDMRKQNITIKSDHASDLTEAQIEAILKEDKPE